MESLVITKKGQELITKMIAGTDTATFTKIMTSDYDYSSATLEDLESLSDTKQSALVSSVKVTDNSLVEVLARIDNSELTSGYYVRAVGLYAKDNDGTEILYGVTICDSSTTPDYIPAFGGKTVTGISYRLNVKVDNSSAVTITIDPAAVPSMEQIEEINETIDTIQETQETDEGKIKTLEDLIGSTSLSGIDDGTVTGIIKSFYAFMKHIEDNAAAHNGMFVSEDITDMWNDGTFSKNVQNGTFKDIFPGMYITKSYTIDGTTYTEDFEVGDLDYHLHHGDTETTSHHALMVMKNGSGTTFQMNSSNVTTGGYTGSTMWGTTIPKFATAMQNTFGSTHVLSHRELLTNGISTSGNSMAGAGLTGYASGWAWFDVLFNIMNNAMRFGVTATSSSFYDTSDCTKQLALFQLDSASKIAHLGKGGARYWDWLRDVASSSGFAGCNGNGYSIYDSASYSRALRGYFLLR